jgi:DNA-binding Lrp family transcriptional regulator
MVTAIALVRAEKGMVTDVAEALAERDEVAEVYSVSGPYDVVAVLKVKDLDALPDLVAGRLQQMNGVADSETLVAFRTYSHQDMERVFSLGID